MFPALQVLLTVTILTCSPTVRTEAPVYKEPRTSRLYYMANLISPQRPKKLSRMYPNLVPFVDMLDPVQRSYQFGFPEHLRRGVSTEVPTEIVFYKTRGTGVPKHMNDPTEKWYDWMRNHKIGNIAAEPLTFTFKQIVNSDFNIMLQLVASLGNERRNVNNDLKYQYLYRDHIREFLIGTWQSWLEDGIFHEEESVWTVAANECIQTDVQCLWRRFFLVILSARHFNLRGSDYLRSPAVHTKLYSSLDTAAMSFWFAYCQVVTEKNLLDKTTMAYCPDPCRSNPCTDMAYTITDNCETVKGGLFEKDFKCTCIETAFWSYSKRACVGYDRCKMNSPCSPGGTVKCHFNLITSEIRCECKVGFMGHACDKPRNACFTRQVTALGSMPAGNRACNVETGSECIPVTGSDRYNCLCRNGWQTDTTWGVSDRCAKGDATDMALQECSVPNCQHRNDPCMSVPCETGDCVASSQQALCQCPITHYGTNCRMRRGYWSIWGPWSSCDPDCGNRRLRHRSRACLGHECLGHQFESAWCLGNADCGVPERLGNYPADRWRTASVLRHTLIALAISIGVGMGIIFACQCCLVIVLKSDRRLLNFTVEERAHNDQIMAYRRLSYKTVLPLK